MPRTACACVDCQFTNDFSHAVTKISLVENFHAPNDFLITL